MFETEASRPHAVWMTSGKPPSAFLSAQTIGPDYSPKPVTLGATPPSPRYTSTYSDSKQDQIWKLKSGRVWA